MSLIQAIQCECGYETLYKLNFQNHRSQCKVVQKIQTLEQSLDAAQKNAARYRMALEEIREVWAGSEVGEPIYAQEAYAIRLCKQMYKFAVDAMKG